MKISINEELNYMKYLFGYQKGRVISEQYKPQLNKDGCEKEYYRDCTTGECTPIPPNTKITYSQKNYESMTKIYGKIEKYNQEYEKKTSEALRVGWNNYLSEDRIMTDYDTGSKSPKYYTYTDFNDYKRKYEQGNFPSIPKIPINKPAIDWIKKRPNFSAWERNYLKMKGEQHLWNSYYALPKTGYDIMDEAFNNPKDKIKNQEILIPLIDKIFEAHPGLLGRNDIADVYLHFKTPPNVILGCVSGSTSSSGTTKPPVGPPPPPPPPPPPIKPPEPIEDPKPIEDPEPTVNPNYPEYSLQYKKKKYLDVKLPKNKVKSVFDRGVLKTPGRFKISEKNPKEIARYVKYYEGYDDNEGNHISGEIEKAQQQNRQIRFLDPVSDEDELAQQRYKEEYAEYKKTK